MKREKIFILGLSGALMLSSLILLANKNRAIVKAEPTGCNYETKLPTVIDLNDSTDSEIRNYYSSLNALGEDELKGTNLLKNLKPILYNMNYYSYDTVWKIYEITDRDWTLSPASGDTYETTYDSTTNKYTKYTYGASATKSGNNPYVHTLYRDDSEAGRIREWENHGKQTNGTDREHIWCQSRGFKADSGASGPAGTDVHHLRSGDSNVNQAIHNNNPYGYVDAVSATGKHEFNNKNKNGSAKHPHAEDQATLVFEPQDSDKGDIARAIFYMAARYNNYAGASTLTPEGFEANLVLVNYATSNGEREDSTPSHAVGMGILQDLLEWNKLDPVDEFEIHRNNLIYKNYQGNRNPFIDFPQWADYIWGTSVDGVYNSTPTGFAKAATDVINDANVTLSAQSLTFKPSETAKISAKSVDNSQITWSVSDVSILTLDKTTSASNEEVTITPLKEGKATITATVTIAGENYSKNCVVTVTNSVTPTPTPSGDSGFNFDTKTLIIIGVVAVVVIIALIIILAVSSKARKKAKKIVKSQAKKTAKNYVKSQQKSNNSSKSKKK